MRTVFCVEYKLYLSIPFLDVLCLSWDLVNVILTAFYYTITGTVIAPKFYIPLISISRPLYLPSLSSFDLLEHSYELRGKSSLCFYFNDWSVRLDNTSMCIGKSQRIVTLFSFQFSFNIFMEGHPSAMKLISKGPST